MTPPSKWLFFPSPVASSSVQLEVDFTLVDSGSQRFDGTSPTWSGTDAGSPDNYALGSPLFRHRNGRTLFRMSFGASGNYANRGDWIAANGSTILYQTTKFTRADGAVLQRTSNVTVSGGTTSTILFLSWNTNDNNATWFNGLSGGDTCNIKLDW